MAIIKDNKRKTFYINYKYKLPSGTWKNVNIRNKNWTFDVGIRYMRSIEYEEIEKELKALGIDIDDDSEFTLSEDNTFINLQSN